MIRPACLLVSVALAGLMATLYPSDAQEKPKKGVATADDLAPGEKSQEFEYVIEGERKKGVCRVLTVDIGGGEKMEFVHISKGTFLMGSPKDELERNNDENQHEVKITNDYYLGKFAVTQAQYKAIVGENPSAFKGDRLPVELVTWNDAVRYCEALSKKLNRKASLPSEAQWEYACRAGTKTPFHFGSKLNGDLANCNGNKPYGTATKGIYKQKTTEVGSYPANPWGLYDMSGNVCQWCQDYAGPYEKLDGNRDPVQLVQQLIDPDKNGQAFPGGRVFRGGSWFDFAGECRSAFRSSVGPDSTYGDSLRVCLPLEK